MAGVGVEGDEVSEVVEGYSTPPGVLVPGVTERQPATMTMDAIISVVRKLFIIELIAG
ncbi:hypothetical protein [Thermococcus barossii]|uniref:hypothetical protein n=1 Tax=Thermococcus barossii TaxID=54077 RepID=UPI001E51951C|nr:hypothetical protein [Thermococcus barossii]